MRLMPQILAPLALFCATLNDMIAAADKSARARYRAKPEKKALENEYGRVYHKEVRDTPEYRASKRAYVTAWRQMKRETDPEYVEKVRQSNSKENSRERSTGWSAQAFKEALVAQHGCCAICGGLLGLIPSRGDTAAADHRHEPKKPRGILCHSCNKGLGDFKENLFALRNAIAYLEQHGVCQPYVPSRNPNKPQGKGSAKSRRASTSENSPK